MHPPDKPFRRMKLLAAVTGVGAMALLGTMTVIGDIEAIPAATGSAMKFSSTTTVTTPPTAPLTSFASPAVKAPHK
ncbi:hypothetical protein P3H80_09240 [Mycolicibacterium septicum]|uniref:hypothetical protein n=1 Tax=Mycolicibacterium septicum TaxID=98668 RepID=UPI0023E0F101|nr:hypothetical protein [Mycolicibacterium septicum]MDF3337605.1 hypothetical protein [Mycolicibacterium septicum]